MGEIFAPIIPALIVGGLILGFRNVIDSMAIVENGTKHYVKYLNSGRELINSYG